MEIFQLNNQYFKNYVSESKMHLEQITQHEYLKLKTGMVEVPSSMHGLDVEMYSDNRKHIKKGVIKYLVNKGCDCRYSGKERTLYIYNFPPSHLVDVELMYILEGCPFNFQIK